MSLVIYLVLLLSLGQSLFALDCLKDQVHVKAYHRGSYYRADGTFVSEADIKEHCRSNTESYKFWQGKFVDQGPANWPYKNEVSKKWTLDEKERIFEAICELPEQIWKKSEYKFYRMKKSKDGENPATSADRIIVLYDNAFSKKYNLSRVIAHEFAHELYKKINRKMKSTYLIATNWLVEFVGDEEVVQAKRLVGYVADDGNSSPQEDFANNVEYHLFDLKNLQEKTPSAFTWIKDNFGDSFKLGSCKK